MKKWLGRIGKFVIILTIFVAGFVSGGFSYHQYLLDILDKGGKEASQFLHFESEELMLHAEIKPDLGETSSVKATEAVKVFHLVTSAILSLPADQQQMGLWILNNSLATSGKVIVALPQIQDQIKEFMEHGGT